MAAISPYRALANGPAVRFESCLEFINALNAELSPPSPQRKRLLSNLMLLLPGLGSAFISYWANISLLR